MSNSPQYDLYRRVVCVQMSTPVPVSVLILYPPSSQDNRQSDPSDKNCTTQKVLRWNNRLKTREYTVSVFSHGYLSSPTQGSRVSYPKGLVPVTKDRLEFSVLEEGSPDPVRFIRFT